MCTASCRNRDWDELLSYETMKVVRVRDRTLGILRILMMAGIFGYIVGYVIIYQKKYMEVETPIGAVAASLQKPSDNTLVSNYPYCTQYNTSYPQTIPPQPPSIDQAECQVWDEYQVVYPPDSLNSLFVTTRASINVQESACVNPLPPGGGCFAPYVNVGPTDNYFMAGIENYTIMIQHSMQARVFYTETNDPIYAGSSNTLDGVLVDSSGHTLVTFGTGRDIITVATLLEAANTLIGQESDVSGNEGESMRDAGIVIIVNVDYNNMDTSALVPGDATYQYQATRIPNAEYKVVEVLQLNNTFRELRNRHGLKIVFIQSGTIGRPTFQATLIQLVTSMGLLSVASLIVELLMLNVMPQRKKYEEYKYENTAEFHRAGSITGSEGATNGETGGGGRH